MNNLIELSNVNKSFGSAKKLKVLKKITYNFKKGKIYSIMGPSGSGKSTLLNLLSLIDRPNSGSIFFENKLIDFNNNNKNDILRANKIGIIYQQDNLLPDFTALENIYLASLAAGKNKQINFNNQKDNDILRSKKIGIIYQQDNLLPDFTSLENIYLAGLAAGKDKITSVSKAKYLLKKVGLISRSDHYPSELSGGEKQRVSIARAVMNDPQIILADEPTGSLDHETAKEIFGILKKQINKERLIIFATHNRFFANKADCLLELVNGNIRTING